MATAPTTPRRWFQFGRPSRRRLTILVGASAVALAVAYLYFWLARPIGAGPAGPTVASAAFESPWTDRRVLLLGIRDSVTAGLGAQTPDLSYFERIAQNPPDEFPELRGVCLAAVLPNLTKNNLAISGSTSLDHLHVIEDNLPARSPDVFGLVVITTGGNDPIHSYGQRPPREGAMYGATLAKAGPWIANFDVRLTKMLDLVDERFPGSGHVSLGRHL